MEKAPKKPKVNQNNTMNSVLTDNKTMLKSRQQIYQENYQKNKEKKKQQQQERYQQNKEKIKAQKKINYAKKKEWEQSTTKQQSAKYYGAEAIKVLMSLKQYTELNAQKQKLYANFMWTIEDMWKEPHNIIQVMKIREEADYLIRDYEKTAKAELARGKSWNSLDDDEKQRLIRYWGYEKAKVENDYLNEAERLERQSQEYLKEIELAKFHEERGKVKCSCYDCEAKREIQQEIKAQFKKDLDNKTIEKEECPNCGRMVKELDEESGVCKKCLANYGN